MQKLAPQEYMPLLRLALEEDIDRRRYLHCHRPF